MSKEKLFSVGEEVEAPFKNGYVVEIETMYGDADGWGSIVIGPFRMNEDESLLEDLLLTLDRMGNAYPNGRGGGNDYNHVEGFEFWFGEEGISQEELEAMPERIQNLLANDWECDPDGYGHQAGYQGYDLFYYDRQGQKFEAHYHG